MAIINDPDNSAYGLKIDQHGSLKATLLDNSNNSVINVADTQPTVFSGLTIFGKNDESLIPIRTDRLGSQAVALYNLLFLDSFEGTTLHPVRWTSTATTMAATQSSIAGVTINSGSITTINTGYNLQSSTRFLKSQRAPLQTKIRARLNHYNNSVINLGFADSSTFNGAPTTGAYWQVSATGVLQPVLTYNSVDITGTSVAFDITKYYTFDIYADDDEVVFTIQDSFTGLLISKQSIPLPLTAQKLWSSTALPLQIQLYNTGVAPSTASQVLLTDVVVLSLDANKLKLWPHSISSLSRSSVFNPFTGAQAATWSNSAEPASATLSNTAAGYTTLGGKFQFAAVAGAATDYALFGFQVPSPANLIITGITIDTWNTGAASATTPTLLTWALGIGSTAVSLATATVTRIGLGAQSIPVASAIGFATTQINKQFQTPLVIPANRWVHVILRMPVGTATASQIIAGMVNIEGYFE